jgi:FKBP-type peptidyl-prolyl cis-trans isomerase
MLKNNKVGVVVSVLIVLVVIGVLFYITINNKKVESTLGGEENNTNMENTQNIEGVKITVLKEGTGDAVATAGDMVAMGYTGMLNDGTVFDSNIDPKFKHVEPFAFTLGSGEVIKGWDVGVAGMKVGEQRKLEIAPDFAYGEAGAGGVIPPNATLTFVVELVAIKK